MNARLILLAGGLLLGLGACSAAAGPDLLSDPAAEATATVCGCFPYGSYLHASATPTPTPTGPWTPPTATATPTWTPRPPETPCADPPCPYPRPTWTPVAAWPPPAITCTPEGTPVPTTSPVFWPPRYRQPPLHAIVGNTEPFVLGAGMGQARPGSVSLAPRTGEPWVSYSLLDPDPGYEASGRIYVKTIDPASGAWTPAASVNEPGYYHLRNAPESAVAAGSDGSVYVLYPRRASPQGTAQVELRRSTDGGQTWGVPYAFPGADGPLADSLRLGVDPAGGVHVAFTQAGGPGPGMIHYFEQRPDGIWRQEIPPVPNQGQRQKEVAFSFTRLADGTIRTTLGWTQGPPDPPGGNGAVYAAYKDGPDGVWSAPARLIDGGADPYGLPDYDPQGLRAISFVDGAGQSWTYLWWAIYSNGRLAFAYSPDGGATWAPTTADGWHEDAVAYYDRSGQPTPGPGEQSRGTVHSPAPFWDGPHERLVTLYVYTDKRAPADGGQGDSFVAYAYGRPGAPGGSWTGYATFSTTPQRVFATTYSAQAQDVFVAPGPDADGYVFAGWTERDSADQFYAALLNPATLISDGNVLP